jgi:RNA polymerase sigma-70 factor (ECF subfamily)
VSDHKKQLAESDFSSKTDEEFVSLSLEKSENFRFIVERYKAKLGHFIRRKAALNKDDVDDLLQDIFIKVFLNLNDFDTSLKFSSWIYRIAHNEVISWYRKKKIRPQVNFEDYEEENIVNWLKDELNIEKHWESKNLKEKIVAEIEKLNDRYKDAIILRFLEEKDYEEISDILQVPTGTVSTLIYRGKNELQKALQKYNI